MLDLTPGTTSTLLTTCPLDIHAENLFADRARGLFIDGQLDAAGLAAATCVDLGFDRDRSAKTSGNRGSFIGCGRDLAGVQDSMPAQNLRRLILVDIH